MARFDRRWALLLSLGCCLAAGSLVACSGGAEQAAVPSAALSEDASSEPSGPTNGSKANLEAEKALIGKEHFADAIPGLEKAVAADDKNAEAHYYLGLAYDRTGKRPEAEQHYKKAHELNPTLTEPIDNLTALYLDDPPRPDDAIALITQALKARQFDPHMLENLGFAYGLKKDADKSSAAYDNALKAYAAAPPDSAAGDKQTDVARVHFGYGVMLLEAKRTDAGVKQLSLAVDGTKDPQILAEISHQMEKAESFDNCVKILDKVIAQKSDAPGPYVRRGVCKNQLKQEKEAGEDFRAAIKADPKFAAGHFYLALNLLALNPKDAKAKAEAKAELQKTIDLGKDTQLGQFAAKKLQSL